MRKIKDLVGQKFGLLTVTAKTDKRSAGSVVWECICSCGNIAYVRSGNLHSGHTVSCGCHKRETSSNVCSNIFTKHGHGKAGLANSTYITWLNMRDRCNNPNNDAYNNYGGRGISVCDEWNDFSNFLADMGERPKGVSIDRINVDLGYFKENCRWATSIEQNNNKRDIHKVCYMGETLTITQLAKRIGAKRKRLYYQLKKHDFNVEKALWNKL